MRQAIKTMMALSTAFAVALPICAPAQAESFQELQQQATREYQQEMNERAAQEIEKRYRSSSDEGQNSGFSGEDAFDLLLLGLAGIAICRANGSCGAETSTGN